MSFGKTVIGSVAVIATVKIISALMDTKPETSEIKEKIKTEYSRRKEADRDICKDIIEFLQKKNTIIPSTVIGL